MLGYASSEYGGYVESTLSYLMLDEGQRTVLSNLVTSEFLLSPELDCHCSSRLRRTYTAIATDNDGVLPSRA